MHAPLVGPSSGTTLLQLYANIFVELRIGEFTLKGFGERCKVQVLKQRTQSRLPFLSLSSDRHECIPNGQDGGTHRRRAIVEATRNC
jgi:hypothetical protein